MPIIYGNTDGHGEYVVIRVSKDDGKTQRILATNRVLTIAKDAWDMAFDLERKLPKNTPMSTYYTVRRLILD